MCQNLIQYICKSRTKVVGVQNVNLFKGGMRLICKVLAIVCALTENQLYTLVCNLTFRPLL
jgi:hypothetical protein